VFTALSTQKEEIQDRFSLGTLKEPLEFKTLRITELQSQKELRNYLYHLPPHFKDGNIEARNGNGCLWCTVTEQNVGDLPPPSPNVPTLGFARPQKGLIWGALGSSPRRWGLDYTPLGSHPHLINHRSSSEPPKRGS
jgi:hypothetical protein